MTNPAPSSDTRAGAELDRAFEQRDGYADAAPVPRIGLFGNGIPETLIAATGALPVHLSGGRQAEASPIDAVIEPFVDDEVRIFLNRLMNGAFSGLRGIVFARDDAPALIAYQYATEWMRQGRAGSETVPLFLWNLVHTDTPAVHAFNLIQTEKLFAFLQPIGLSRPTPAAITEAAAAETGRRKALDLMQAAVGISLSGATAFRWRNAGRVMAAGEHARLIGAALSDSLESPPDGVRLGLVGSPVASVSTYDMLETFGPVVCDLQPWGRVWPGPGNTGRDLDEILVATASDASCPRITPTTAHRAAMVEALVGARCDLVVCQLAQTDDTFGWEIPGLAADLAARGIAFVNLGFRDAEPDAAWRERAATLIANALEAK